MEGKRLPQGLVGRRPRPRGQAPPALPAAALVADHRGGRVGPGGRGGAGGARQQRRRHGRRPRRGRRGPRLRAVAPGHHAEKGKG